MWIHVDTCMGIHVDTWGYMWIHGDTCGYMWIHGDTCGYMGIHVDIWGYICGNMGIYIYICIYSGRNEGGQGGLNPPNVPESVQILEI